jgi:hypothetical protein
MKKFDELLDGVLREDATAQPRVGLEERVMARVRADGQRRPRWRFVALGTVAAALPVCVVALLVWPGSAPPVQHVESTPAPTVSTVPKKIDLEPLRNERLKTVCAKGSVRPESEIVARVNKALPKLEVFPSPAPEDIFPQPVKANEEERQLSEVTSKKVGEALAALRQEQSEPLQIAAIKIAPLQ